mmetsp:Transcript_33892/g.52807  ORF Transcript_33892/g.52807 Transcript_33892/m.52807 type:complete len:184 (+) Transcript_33892:426-977(+)
MLGRTRAWATSMQLLQHAARVEPAVRSTDGRADSWDPKASPGLACRGSRGWIGLRESRRGSGVAGRGRWCEIQSVPLGARLLGISRHDWPDEWIRRKRCWGDMDKETQELWMILGWNADNWDLGRRSEDKKSWADFSSKEYHAARELGYDQWLWDAEDKSAPRRPKKKVAAAEYSWGKGEAMQ